MMYGGCPYWRTFFFFAPERNFAAVLLCINVQKGSDPLCRVKYNFSREVALFVNLCEHNLTEE
jgi:hypothetical protein